MNRKRKVKPKAAHSRRAQLVAEAVAVLCPWCAEPQPNHEGSEMFVFEDFAKVDPPLRQCVSCDQWILVVNDSKVQFQ